MPSTEKRRSVAPLSLQAQYDALLDAYYALDAGVQSPDSATPAVGRAQRLLELQSQLAQLSAAQGELRRALGHYETVVAWIEAHEAREKEQVEAVAAPEPPAALTETVVAGDVAEAAPTTAVATADDEIPARLRAVLAELKINALANMSTLHFRAGDAKTAMAQLLKAKQAMRALQAAPEIATDDDGEPRRQLEAALAANYAVLLRAKGAIEDAAVAAEAALRLAGPPHDSTAGAARRKSDTTVPTARQLAAQVVVSCARAQSAASDQAPHRAPDPDAAVPSDPAIAARCLNNAALQCFEGRDVDAALRHLLAAYRATTSATAMAATPGSGPPRDERLEATLRYHIGRALTESGATASLPGDAANEPVDARRCLTLTLESAPDPLVGVLARAALAELSFQDGDFVSASDTLTCALEELKELTAEPDESAQPLSVSKQALVKIQGALESWLGNALLAAGQDASAEAAHERDLELALESEDLRAQQRALRNLALLYSATQRFAEAATLWREALEVATVLASPRDQMAACGALGSALHALAIVDAAVGEHSELLAAPENQPRALFLKQRALAAEHADLDAQTRAQQAIVGTFEWAPRAEELEKRLEACDLFLRLSEQLGDAALRADACRALANAINAQVRRLAERGARFAEAIAGLTAKRNAVLQKLRETASEASVAPARGPRRQALTHVDVVAQPFV